MINSPKKIFIRPSHGKGLGVFASESISQGETIEDCPLLSLPIKKGESSSLLLDYRFNYPLGLDFEEQVIALGYGSLYNHSDTPNAMWVHHPNLKKVFRFVAIKEIALGEEILVFYGDETYWSDGRVSSRTKLV